MGVNMLKFENKEGKSILKKMVKIIQDNKDYLGEVDGVIGDGDHGVNMKKGFMLFQKKYENEEYGFIQGLNNLGMILLNEIGGSMGPIYGTLFMTMAEKREEAEKIGLDDLLAMLEAGKEELFTIVDARVGDKTLVDTLSPAIDALGQASNEKMDFRAALITMCDAAKKGKDSTKNMVAKYGRASRLGERSRGTLDAGALSCYLLLKAMADGIIELL